MDAAQQPGIRFTGVVVDRIRFDDIAVGARPAKDLAYQVAVDRRVHSEPPAVDITVSFLITGPETDFSLDVGVTGRFEPLSGHENMRLEEFARINGPAILLPFVREVVANLTARTRQGIVLLPPINVVALLEGKSPVPTAGLVRG